MRARQLSAERSAVRLGHSRGRFLSATPAPGRTPPGPQATRASGTDPGRQGAARPGTQRGEGSGAARARRGGQSGAPRPLGGGDGGHRSRAAGGRGRPSSLREVAPGSPWQSSWQRGDPGDSEVGPGVGGDSSPSLPSGRVPAGGTCARGSADNAGGRGLAFGHFLHNELGSTVRHQLLGAG